MTDPLFTAYGLGMIAGFVLGWTLRHVEGVLRARR